MDKEAFDRQAGVVASAWPVLENRPGWEDALYFYNLGFPFAHLHNAGLGTLKAEGKEKVTDTYDYLLNALGVKDNPDFYSFYDLLAEYNKET